jgi:hypothetical protein
MVSNGLVDRAWAESMVKNRTIMSFNSPISKSVYLRHFVPDGQGWEKPSKTFHFYSTGSGEIRTVCSELWDKAVNQQHKSCGGAQGSIEEGPRDPSEFVGKIDEKSLAQDQGRSLAETFLQRLTKQGSKHHPLSMTVVDVSKVREKFKQRRRAEEVLDEDNRKDVLGELYYTTVKANNGHRPFRELFIQRVFFLISLGAAVSSRW